MSLSKRKILYPLPIFALTGLLLGGFLYFIGQKQFSGWTWLFTLIVGGTPIVYRTFKGMLQGQFASDIVAMLAIVTALISGQAFAGTIVVLMQSGGEAIENYGMRRASSSLAALLNRAPKFARRKNGHQLEEIPVEEVLINDLLVVRRGDLVPVDGTIVEGTAEIDDSAITGEPLRANKTIGSHVLSGSIAMNGMITIRADRVSQESQYAKIVRMVKIAQEEKAPIQRLADRYAIFFTPLAIVMAILGYFLTFEMSTFLAVLVVATPCPLILATPLAVICGINKAADSNIIIKGGTSIEQVASTDVIFFDKTGTITYGTPFVEKIVPLNGLSEDDLLRYAASLEQFSSHSIATAIVKKAQDKKLTLYPAINVLEIPGQGIKGLIENSQILVGSKLIFEQYQIPLTPLPSEENRLIVFVSIDHICVGTIVLSDKIRPEASELMKQLPHLGVKEIVMLTGDHESNALAIAAQVGIEKVEAEILPQQKAYVVQNYKSRFSHLTMVGDGINDAPALATATVGIAMGAHGTAISAESADIVLLVDDLSKVAEVIQIGKQMLKIAKQSIWIGIGLSFLLMCVAIFGVIPPAIGATLQEMIDVSVILTPSELESDAPQRFAFAPLASKEGASIRNTTPSFLSDCRRKDRA
jgi:heavy metal translocating P-type ATPase